MNVKLIIGFIVTLLAVIFILQNVEVVSIRFLFWQVSASRALWMFIIFSAGLFGGYLLGSLQRGIRRKEQE